MKRFEKVDMNRFNKMLQDTLNKKDVRLNGCDKLIKFITKEEFEKENGNKNIPYIFGGTMICNNCEFEDDISQGYVTYKNGYMNNLADYLSDAGLFDDINNWEDALNILDTIETELKDRQRVIIKKEGEVSLEEERARNLKDKFSSIEIPGEVDITEDGDGIWNVFGGILCLGEEENVVTFRASFLPNENRVPILITVYNIESFSEASETIDNFRNNITKDFGVKELCEEYEVMFGTGSEGEPIGVMAIQYEFDHYSEQFIVDTFFKIAKSALSNIYGLIDEGSTNAIDENVSKLNVENYTAMRELTGYIESYNNCIDDLYLEEDDYDNDEYLDEVNKKKINYCSVLKLSNNEIQVNYLEVILSDCYYDQEGENLITITHEKMGMRRYSI